MGDGACLLAPSHTDEVDCAEGIDGMRLQRGYGSCYLRVTVAGASLMPAEGG